jgi:acetyl-CoA acetyltransferase
MDVAIVGIGLYPFGRHEGVSALEMGAAAARAALDDAGVRWQEIDTAYAGSLEVLQPDTLNKHLGLTGIPFTTLYNGCATGGNLLISAANAIAAGVGELAIAVGLDKHPRGAFSVGDTLESIGLGQWYGETGLALNPQYFSMKTRRYMHDHGITEDCLHRVAVKAFANGARNPQAWRRRALSYEEIAGSDFVCDPLRKYHFCSPSEGAAAMVLCRAEDARRYADKPVYEPLRARFTRGVRAGRPRSRGRRRGAAAGHRGRPRDHAHGRVRLLQGRRAGGVDRRGRDRDRRAPAGQHRRRPARERRAHRRVGAAAGVRDLHAAARRGG